MYVIKCTVGRCTMFRVRNKDYYYCFNGTYDGCQYSIIFPRLDLIPKLLTRDIS